MNTTLGKSQPTNKQHPCLFLQQTRQHQWLAACAFPVSVAWTQTYAAHPAKRLTAVDFTQRPENLAPKAHQSTMWLWQCGASWQRQGQATKQIVAVPLNLMATPVAAPLQSSWPRKAVTIPYRSKPLHFWGVCHKRTWTPNRTWEGMGWPLPLNFEQPRPGNHLRSHVLGSPEAHLAFAFKMVFRTFHNFGHLRSLRIKPDITAAKPRSPNLALETRACSHFLYASDCVIPFCSLVTSGQGLSSSQQNF